MSVAADGISVTDGITVTPAEHPSNRGRNEAYTKMRIVKQYTTHTTGVRGLDFGLRIPAGAHFGAEFTAAYEGNEKRTCNTPVGIILHGTPSHTGAPDPIHAQGGRTGASRASWVRGTAHSSSLAHYWCSWRSVLASQYSSWRSTKFRVQGNGALKRIAPVGVNSSSADVRVGITEKENGLEVRGWERNVAEPRGRMIHAAHGRRRRRYLKSRQKVSDGAARWFIFSTRWYMNVHSCAACIFRCSQDHRPLPTVEELTRRTGDTAQSDVVHEITPGGGAGRATEACPA
ncbi:hypothetical protein C8R44DRAFT_752547 [Mycena epipterygia]|nr:hypothetical protein C8R44DRAFT_752547 [Mycena epipterygia]